MFFRLDSGYVSASTALSAAGFFGALATVDSMHWGGGWATGTSEQGLMRSVCGCFTRVLGHGPKGQVSMYQPVSDDIGTFWTIYWTIEYIYMD